MSWMSLALEADRGVLPDHWLHLDSDILRDEARLHYGACDEGDLDPCDLDWRLIIDLPTRLLLPLMEDRQGWARWYEEEIEMHEECHPWRSDEYRSLVHEPLESPIVVTLEAHRIQIWDGWHRTASRIIGGAEVIPAIVGHVPGACLHEILVRHIGQH